MRKPGEGQEGRAAESARSESDELRRRVGEKVAKACEGNAAKLLKIHDVWDMPCGSYARLRSHGYMELTIGRVESLRVSIAHYGRQNGDRMCDPEMMLELAPDRSWIRPRSYRNDYAGVSRSVGGAGNPELERELTEFLTMWLTNLDEQWFGTPSPEEVARRVGEREAFIREHLEDIARVREANRGSAERGL